MKKRTIIIGAVSSILIATVAVAATQIHRDSEPENPPPGSADNHQPGRPKNRPARVEITIAKKSAVIDTITATGTTAPIREVTFASEIPGKIESMRAKLGDTVRKGQVLALVNRQTLTAEQDRAQAAFDLAKSTHARMVNLGEDIVSRQQLDETQSAVNTAKAGLSIAQNNAKKGVVRSNLTGVVTAKLKEKAEYTSPGSPLYHIVDHRTIVVEAQIAESEVASVKRGAKVAVRIDALDETFDGEVQAILPVADQASKTFTVRVEIENRDLRILVGMSAHLTIRTGTPKAVILVSQDTIIEGPKGRTIFVARGETAVRIPVRLGATYEDKVVIESGIEPGDQLITLGHRRLEEGQAIEII